MAVPLDSGPCNSARGPKEDLVVERFTHTYGDASQNRIPFFCSRQLAFLKDIGMVSDLRFYRHADPTNRRNSGRSSQDTFWQGLSRFSIHSGNRPLDAHPYPILGCCSGQKKGEQDATVLPNPPLRKRNLLPPLLTGS